MWHGVKLHEPDWGYRSHSVSFTTTVASESVRIQVILNAYWEPLVFELPPGASAGAAPWRRWIDTFLDSPQDIVDWAQAPLVAGDSYRLEARSVVVLFAGLETAK